MLTKRRDFLYNIYISLRYLYLAIYMCSAKEILGIVSKLETTKYFRTAAILFFIVV